MLRPMDSVLYLDEEVDKQPYSQHPRFSFAILTNELHCAKLFHYEKGTPVVF